MTMQHRFKMPPGSNAKAIWFRPVNCARVRDAVLDSQETLDRYRRHRERGERYAKAAPSHFPYDHRTQAQVREARDYQRNYDRTTHG